jgi:hypothetical protein
MALGDLEASVDMDGKFLTVMTLRKLGDNYEGISALRSIYGNWSRKQVYLKLLAIGIERYAVGTPVGSVPVGKEISHERQIFEQALAQFTSHQSSFLTKTEGWDIDVLQNSFDAEKVKEAILYEDLQMAKSFVANHLELGTGGNGGAYALATDLSDQFLSIIQNDAEIITRAINETVIKELIDINFGPQEDYPKLKVTGINDKLGKESADIIKQLVDSNILTANNSLEVFLRKEFNLPKLSKEEIDSIGVRKVEQPSEVMLHEGKLTLNEVKTQKALKNNMTKWQESYKDYMSISLTEMVDNALKSFENKLKKTDKKKWNSLALDYKIPQTPLYSKGLRDLMAEQSAGAIKQAKSEAPASAKINLSEEDYKGLPKELKTFISVESLNLTKAQISKLETSAVFMFTGSLDENPTLEKIIDDMKMQQVKIIQGQTVGLAAANTSTKVENRTRFEYFHSPEVFNEIYAFEFMNSDPKSAICKDLKGRIFRKEDQTSQQFLPPLHHNCKSFIAAIYEPVETGKVTNLVPSKSSLLKEITLSDVDKPCGGHEH